ncbi:unnamed protein product [Spirodela intermedia]|uniref:Uncharacterized protein n=1 Tax=Spirodela intermedia TaxID=51605 RepID=A0A7I8KJE2_SPIIN|nr:unnamed protein product [Spirodela intermedia]
MSAVFSLTDAAFFSAGGGSSGGPPRARVSRRTTKTGEERVLSVSDALRDGRRVISPLLAGPLLPASPFSAPSPLPSLKQQPQREGDGDKQKYYVNMGYAIRTLREEFPVIFYREPSFDIYREDVVFKDRINTFVGIDNYRRIFWALRISGRMFFKALWLDIVSIWQPAENVVMIRWIVHGIPRVPWDSHGRFDGTSEFKLDGDGKIFEHRVDNVAVNSPPKFRVLAVEELIQSLGCPSAPGPTFFELAAPPPPLPAAAGALLRRCLVASSRLLLLPWRRPGMGS